MMLVVGIGASSSFGIKAYTRTYNVAWHKDKLRVTTYDPRYWHWARVTGDHGCFSSGNEAKIQNTFTAYVWDWYYFEGGV